jgi:cell division protein FtsB
VAPVRGAQALTVLLIAAILGVAASVVVGDDGMTHWLRLRLEQRQLGDMAVRLMQGNAALRQRIEAIRTDDQVLESVVRRELGLVRPNETVYRFDSDTEPRS